MACPAQLGGYERGKGRHSWAFVDFEHPELDLTAIVSCNGARHNSRGVSICQSKAGLIQEIQFQEKVLWPEKNTCIKMTSKDEKTFRFSMPKGQCVFRFMTKENEEKFYRLTTIGYEKILIRGN